MAAVTGVTGGRLSAKRLLWCASLKEVAVIFYGPIAELVPSPLPLGVYVSPWLVLHTGMLNAPLDQLPPAVDCHVCLAYESLVEIMR